MRVLATVCFALLGIFGFSLNGQCQLKVNGNANAAALAQQLVGAGVLISNAKLTSSGQIRPAGTFSKGATIDLGIDSGIVITSGRAASEFRLDLYGVNGDGTLPASQRLADNDLDLLGDNSLAAELSLPPTELFDAIALEFDFIPFGDTIRFNYVMSSEEYTPGTVCIFNDAFGFFISGPGITGEKNIALIPGTNIPVAISNVNNITAATCVSFPQYYVDKTSSIHFMHEGHTTVFTAVAKVIPCETYHLKLVISDVGDPFWDSAVFIEAGSLSSNAVSLEGNVQVDPSGTTYLAEGCAPGDFIVKRPKREVTPLTVNLVYKGTALNGTDIQALPPSVTIPANELMVTVPIRALVDALDEGTEVFMIYALGGCANGIPSDSLIIDIREYDLLSMQPDTATVCREKSIQLGAPAGFDSYAWQPAATLDNATAYDPLATPVADQTFYSVVAISGTCRFRDSILVAWRDPGASITAGPDTTIAFGQPLKLIAVENGPVPVSQFVWSPPDHLDNPFGNSVIAIPPRDIEYTVEGTTDGGCIVRDRIYVKVYKGPQIYVPTGFTPNGDGQNDILRAIPAGIKLLKHFSLFNRWGQLVFSTNNAALGWDGTINGTRQPSGTYVWVADAVDYTGRNVTYKGIVTLIR